MDRVRVRVRARVASERIVKRRYELIDSLYPDWPGERYTSLERALRVWGEAMPAGRFFVWDRQEKVRVAG